jgi:K+-transporting ATPase KdpF subunit
MKGNEMGVLTLLTAVVTMLLLVYLFAAMVRPEWF